jgi:hypothetical protein
VTGSTHTDTELGPRFASATPPLNKNAIKHVALRAREKERLRDMGLPNMSGPTRDAPQVMDSSSENYD